MRLGVIADVHGNAPALAAVLGRLQDACDEIVFLGDLAGYYPFVNEAADLLHDAGVREAVLGNHDAVLRQCLATSAPPSEAYSAKYGHALERAWRGISSRARAMVVSWEPSAAIVRNGVRVALTHGAPWDALHGRVYPDFAEWNRFEEHAADVFLLGHTHYALSHRAGARLVVNPGSVGQPRDRSDGACYAIVDLPAREVLHHRVPYEKTAVLDDARLYDPELPYLSEVLTR